MVGARVLAAPWRFAAGLLVVAACGGNALVKVPAGDARPSVDDANDGGSSAADAPVPPDAPAQSDAVADGPASDPALESAPVEAGRDAPTVLEVGGDLPLVLPTLPALLARTWTAYGQGGNCIDIKAWYTFGADGTVVQRDIDENACTHVPRLLDKITGRYTLTDHVVEMTMDGIGIDFIDFRATRPKETVTKLIQRFPVMAAVLTTPSIGAGHLGLDLGAFTGNDGTHFQSERYALLEVATGRHFEQRTLHSITIDPPLPLPAGTACKVDIDLSLTSFDAGANPVSESGTFHVSYMAVVRATDGEWLRVVPQKLDGLPSDQLYVAWTGILNDAGFASRTDRFRNAFAMPYYLGHAVGDPHVLSGSLPQGARWYEATKPPPVQ